MRSEPTNKWAQKPPERSRSGHTGRGSGRPWQRVSRALRANRPLCEVCMVKPSTEVHHKIKWNDSVEGRLDPRNLVACCRSCHEILERGSHGA